MHVLFFFQNGRRIGDRKMKLILNRMMKCGAYLCTVIVVFLAGVKLFHAPACVEGNEMDLMRAADILKEPTL